MGAEQRRKRKSQKSRGGLANSGGKAYTNQAIPRHTRAKSDNRFGVTEVMHPR